MAISSPVNVSVNGVIPGTIDSHLMPSPSEIYPTITSASYNSVVTGSTSTTSSSAKSSNSYTPRPQKSQPMLRHDSSSSSERQKNLPVSSFAALPAHRLLPSPSISSLSSSASSVSSFTNQKIIDHVQAAFKFSSEKSHSLSFNVGDTIRVLLKLESGWWDGVNPQGQRGWFPSNYVVPLAHAQLPPSADTTISCTADINSNIGARGHSQASAQAAHAAHTAQPATANNSDFHPATTDYKHVELSADSIQQAPEIATTQWLSSDTQAGRFYYNPSLKIYAASLPFTPQKQVINGQAPSNANITVDPYAELVSIASSLSVP